MTRSGWLHSFFREVIDDRAESETLPSPFAPVTRKHSVFNIISGFAICSKKTAVRVNKKINVIISASFILNIAYDLCFRPKQMPDKQFQKLTPVKPKLLVFASQKLGCGA